MAGKTKDTEEVQSSSDDTALSTADRRSRKEKDFMDIAQMKRKTITSLVKAAQDLGVQGTSGMRKQDLMFSILEAQTKKNGLIFAEGVLEILDESSQVREYSRQLEQKSRELQAATAELKAANERLKELDRMKDEFVSTVSHELRTPLTSIRAFSEILHGNLDLPRGQRQEFLAITVKETERLTRLINDLLDIAKIESGRMEWHMESHDLRDLVSEAATSVSQLFREHGVTLVQHLPAQAATALVDRDRVQQVIINLLSNACKFCPEQTGRVEARLAPIDAGLRLTVKDNGPGIPPEALDRVFEKFHQVKEGDGGTEKGTGLGLAICRGIVEHHGGRIWAENSPDVGATFVCEVPESGHLHKLSSLSPGGGDG